MKENSQYPNSFFNKEQDGYTQKNLVLSSLV